MQEEVTQRTVALCVEATKLSAGMLQQAMKKAVCPGEGSDWNLPPLRQAGV